jgi:hypothetical protein
MTLKELKEKIDRMVGLGCGNLAVVIQEGRLHQIPVDSIKVEIEDGLIIINSEESR